jgi:hypothetical protein
MATLKMISWLHRDFRLGSSKEAALLILVLQKCLRDTGECIDNMLYGL